MLKRKKPKSLKRLKEKAWKLISIRVRSTGATGDLNQCFTCFKWFNWKYELQAGHYIHNKLDFDTNNLKPQCIKCNHFLRGNLGVYAERLIKIYGQNWIDQLRAKAQIKGNNYSIQEVEEIIKKYG